jgi:endonuclease III
MKTYLNYGGVDNCDDAIVLEDEVKGLLRLAGINHKLYDVRLTFTDCIRIEIIVDGEVAAYSTV